MGSKRSLESRFCIDISAWEKPASGRIQQGLSSLEAQGPKRCTFRRQGLANAWLLKDGKLMPYEFFFSPLAKDSSVDLTHDNIQAFLEEFVKSAKFSKLDGIIALRMFPGKGYRGGLEFTEDRANIVLEPGQYDQEPNSAVDVTWYLEPGYLEARGRCKCGKPGPNYHYHSK
ncbi:hypothetical protein GJ744_008130 [Endocarpon pusillum]|uniref:Uncharacterized protein n=1 Tax=Endocarpon pusillum TaxID=364733 RepID=A0A8H7AM15_9EURO|nr:hypothetical protein GJ744_008130 [Endocarpon pusillum]